jgi:hypothetical protein
MLRLRAHDSEDAKVKPQGLKLPYKIPTEYQSPSNIHSGDAYDPVFNPLPGVVPASSIEDKSNDEIYPAAAEGTALCTLLQLSKS